MMFLLTCLSLGNGNIPGMSLKYDPFLTVAVGRKKKMLGHCNEIGVGLPIIPLCWLFTAVNAIETQGKALR